ncbi:MAG: RDD family protein [Phycisphaeraceae bacterium]|nr:MAG: RDD family protein [Phycisphaeraceae bacterium]
MLSHARRLLGIIFVLLATVAFARADGYAIGVAGVDQPDAAVPEVHGWVVMPRPDGDGYMLVHLPPRDAAVHGGIEGLARRARELADTPVAIAADGRRVYTVFNGEPRTLRSLDAVPTPVDGIWNEVPEDRWTPYTPPPANGDVLGLAIENGRPTILLAIDGKPTLYALDDEKWSEAELPDSDPAGRWRLLGDTQGLVLVRVNKGKITSWRRDASTGWREREIAVSADAEVVGAVPGGLVLLAPDGADKLSVLVANENSDAAASLVATVDRPGPADKTSLGVVVLPDATGRLVLLWAEPVAKDEGFAHMIREISLSTGHVLYDGPVEQIMPVSASEFRLIAIALMLVLVVSLYVVLRPVNERDAVSLPEGWALAGPGRRFVASVLDALVCAVPVSWLLDVPLQQIFSAGALLAPGTSWVAIPAVFALGAVYGALAEAAFGTTLGKFLLGCRVIRVGPDGGRPGLAACFIRNLIKWVLPPVAALAMLEPSGRHRGDLLAGVVVAMPALPPTPPDEGA